MTAMRTIGALIFPDFELLDLYGPLEMFGLLPEELTIRVVAESDAPVASKPGVRTVPDETTAPDAAYDILLVPGGMGTRREVENAPLLDWIAATASRSAVTASVCTGSALLARAGVLDGRRATTNKKAWDWATSQGPKVLWQPQARWVEDGNLFTSSGISAGTDMSLALIARLLGEERADAVALHAEYERVRDPGHDPFAAHYGL